MHFRASIAEKVVIINFFSAYIHANFLQKHYSWGFRSPDSKIKMQTEMRNYIACCEILKSLDKFQDL